MSPIMAGVAKTPRPPTWCVSSCSSISLSVRPSSPTSTSGKLSTAIGLTFCWMGRVRKAIFPAAGLGTRCLPVTKAQPKEMLPLVDKPTIQYGVEEAIASGIEQVIMVTGGGKRAIVDHFDRSLELEHYLEQRGKSDLLRILAEVDDLSNQLDITYIQQKEPLGLGHAVWTARRQVEGEPCAVLLADAVILGEEPCLKQLIDAHRTTGATVLAVGRVA